MDFGFEFFLASFVRYEKTKDVDRYVTRSSSRLNMGVNTRPNPPLASEPHKQSAFSYFLHSDRSKSADKWKSKKTRRWERATQRSLKHRPREPPLFSKFLADIDIHQQPTIHSSGLVQSFCLYLLQKILQLPWIYYFTRWSYELVSYFLFFLLDLLMVRSSICLVENACIPYAKHWFMTPRTLSSWKLLKYARFLFYDFH